MAKQNNIVPIFILLVVLASSLSLLFFFNNHTGAITVFTGAVPGQPCTQNADCGTVSCPAGSSGSCQNTCQMPPGATSGACAPNCVPICSISGGTGGPTPGGPGPGGTGNVTIQPECHLNTTTNKCEGVCKLELPGGPKTCVPTGWNKDGTIASCGCERPCNQLLPPNCDQGFCGDGTDPRAECTPTPDNKACACGPSDCKDRPVSYCSGPCVSKDTCQPGTNKTIPGAAGFCEVNPATGPACETCKPQVQPPPVCIKNQCGASCGKDADCGVNATCDLNSCSCIAKPPPQVCTDKDKDGFFKEGKACGTKADCNDGDAKINPNGKEVCNGKDDDCDGKIDENWDADGDGFVRNDAACKGVYKRYDCNDDNSGISPGQTEICIDGIDNNCNNLTDSAAEGCTATNLTKSVLPKFTIGNGKCEPPGETQQNAPVDCGCPEGQVLVGTKCEEEKAQVCGNDIQEAPEECDGTDNSLCPGFCGADCSCPFIVADGICSKDAGENRKNSPQDCPLIDKTLLISLIILIAIAAAGGVGYYFYRRKQELASLAEVHDVMTPTTGAEENIDSYINNTLSLGYSPDQIRDTLTGAGWDADTVDSALTDAQSDLQKLGDSTERYGVEAPHEDTVKVDKYVKDMISQGYSPTQIKTSLETGGWSQDTVEAEIGKVTQPELQKSAENAGVAKPSKDTTKAEEWASKKLKEGHTTEQVKGTLETAGWPPEVVKGAVKV